MAKVIRVLKGKCKVFLMFLQTKKEEKMFIRILLRLKTIKRGHVDAFLGEPATKKVRLLLSVVKLQN